MSLAGYIGNNLMNMMIDMSPTGRNQRTLPTMPITDALRTLPPKLRAVVVLRDIYDLPHEMIAAELGITESAAKVRLHRARKRLRERLYSLNNESELGEADDGQAHAV